MPSWLSCLLLFLANLLVLVHRLDAPLWQRTYSQWWNHMNMRGDYLSTRIVTGLPHDPASDIQLFMEFIFHRKVPVTQMMAWQKGPLSSPLLTLNQALKWDVVKFFKVIQHIMGGRKHDRPTGIPLHNGSTTSLLSCTSLSLLEEERWSIECFQGVADALYIPLLFYTPTHFTFGRSHRRDRQVLLWTISSHLEERPAWKTALFAEIETAADAAFNPSTFSESLDATLHLQEQNYPNEKIPIILPFLADGILAPGGTKCEGIFHVPRDSDLISQLKLRIDRGYYTLENVDDPHMLASLLKLWLCELCDPSRVVLFVVSFLQLFLEEKALARLKMTATNMALILSPNLLGCSPQSMTVVFMNAQ
ncbi:hypothetical protein EDC04DRAFT_2869974 [Pisolithus marmoratus]|nr:hypothetical protein EDC04DRAFT_2869974 [Pisolithus marmoratus]